MATSKDPVTSDTEGQEKPVRKQLQKASISRAPGEILETQEAASSDGMEVQNDQAETADGERDGDKAEPAHKPRKKRSSDEVDEDLKDRPAARTQSQHTRKRSRDSTAEEDDIHNGRKVSNERKRDLDVKEDADTADATLESASSERPGTPEAKSGKRSEEKVEAMASPKTKRSRLHSTTAEGERSAAALVEAAPKDVAASDAAVEDPPEGEQSAERKTSVAEAKPQTDAKSPTIPFGSGFANTSATSPFGAIASPPKSPSTEAQQTSASAFAASGFGSLAGAATSGFGALGKTSGGPAGGWGSKKPLTSSEDGAEKTSTFGGALGQQSGFGAAADNSVFGSSGGSAFGGKLGGGGAFGGSGFGSLGGAAGLSSFASGKPSPFASGSTKPVKPFGAPANEDEDGEGDHEEDDGNGLKSPLSQESDKQDERFYAQEHETGEEGEVTEFNCRAKLYNFAVVDAEKGKKEWKERGLGTVRLNVTQPAAAEDDLEAGTKAEDGDAKSLKVKARLVMRAEGSHRLILNTPVQKEIKFGAVGGGPPQGGLILFMGAVDGDGSLQMLQLKMKQANALELHEKIKDLQEAM